MAPALLAVLASLASKAAEPCTYSVPARSAAECPAIFGDDAAREANRERREALLVDLGSEPYGFAIVYRGDWLQPRLRQYRGLELVDTALGDTCEPVALVQLEENEAGCDPGLYALPVDARLGGLGTAILGILDGILLFEEGEELAFLSVEEEREVSWRMIWYPRWHLPHPVTRAPPAPSAPAPKRGRR
jgi:hypothetical protein